MRRRHSSSRRPKKPVAWFASNGTYVDGGTDLTLAAGAQPTVTILAMHQRNAVATPELVEQIQRHTIETVRGEILVYGEALADESNAVPFSLLLYHAGVRVVELLPDGTPSVYSPSAANEADDDWMWLCHRVIPPYMTVFTLPGGVTVSPPASTNVAPIPAIEVHIKSKRKLLDNEALVIYEQATVAFPRQDLGNIHVHKYLRTLVSRPA